MRIVAWNIRAGGGARVDGIHDQLVRWSPDIVCLCEFRASPPSRKLAGCLADCGLTHQETTAELATPGLNSLLLASRWPVRRVALRRMPSEPRRWLAAEVEADRRFVLGLMHAPNMVTGRKLVFLEAVLALASQWRRGPAVFLGDTNCGWPGIDEERPVFGEATRLWLDSLAALGWRDAFRYLKADERFFTWYSPNAGNGFRLDQAFVNRGMIERLIDARYEWGTQAVEETSRPSTSPGRTEFVLRREALSDHAALLLDLG